MNTWTLLPVDSWQHVLYAVVGFAHGVALAVLVHLQCAKKKKDAQAADKKPAAAKAPKAEVKPAPAAAKEKTTTEATAHTDVADPDLKSKSDYNIKTEPEGPQSAMAPQQGDKFVAKGGGVFVDKDGNPISQHAQPNDVRN
ncbi:hypothetical protein AAVH_06564 [Aphelenchoides avenae]|nr:hypothetical protein AAVH_06564 [Aphelenchus avenae]